MKSFIAAMLITLLGSLVLAETPAIECLDAEQVASVLADFKITRWDGSSFRPAGKVPLCKPDDVLYKVASALLLIQQQNADQSPESSSLIMREGAMNYFKTRIEVIQLIDNPARTSCASEGTVAFVIPGDGRKTYICAEYFKTFDALENSATLLHEARHVEGYDHAHCAHGSLAGKDQDSSGYCDSSFDYQGSYGVEAGYYIHLAKKLSASAMKDEARSKALGYLVERFNEYPWDIKPGVLVQETSGQLSFFDGKVTPVSYGQSLSAIMDARNGLPTFFSVEDDVKSYWFTPQLIKTGGFLADYFNQKVSAADRQDLLDMSYGGSGPFGCLLYVKKLHCFAKSESVEIPLSRIQPRALLYIPGSHAYLSVIGEDGLRYILPASFESLKKADERDFVSKTPKSPVISYAETDIGFYGASYEFQLMRQSTEPGSALKKGSWQVVPEYGNRKVKKVLPFHWSQKLETL